MTGESVPDLLIATSPAQANALAHPTRHRLLLELGEAGATVSQLSNRLRTNKGNVAHHIGVLLAAGLVRKGPTRTVRGGTEQYYLRTARRIQFEGNTALVAMMENLTAELAGDATALLNHRILRMTRRQAAALTAHLDETVNNLTPAAEREPQYGVLVSVYRRPTRGRAPSPNRS